MGEDPSVAHCISGVPPPREGERLCWGSSCFPWFAVPEHGVEDGDEFAHGSYQRDEFGFASGDQSVAKFLEFRVVSDCAECVHEEAISHPVSPAATEAFTAPFA